ncbi:MAG: hypothetical protein WC942_08335 [Clostridia bacterium]|jgi:hypothetical protein
MAILKIINQDVDGGGDLSVTINTLQELKIFFTAHHFSLFRGVINPDNLDEYIPLAQSIRDGCNYTYIHRTTKRRWYKIEDSLSHEFLEPYIQHLQRLTGYNLNGTTYGINLMPYIGTHAYKHTHLLTALDIINHKLYYTIYLQSEKWNGILPHERAPIYAKETMQDFVGETPLVPEFLEVATTRSGVLYKRNPKYGKKRYAQPARTNQAIVAALIDYWHVYYATPKQKEIIAYDKQYAEQMGLRPSMELAYVNSIRTPDGYISWDDFANMN